MRKSAVCVVALGVAAAVAVSGCSPKKSSKKESGPEVGVILPDTTTSQRYTQYDAPLLTKAFAEAGVKADIQNAEGSNSKFVAIAQSMISEGVKVLMIDPADPVTGISVEQAAKTAGIQVIDYDRVNLGGSAQYYVSFDNEAVGKLQAQTLVSCMNAKGVKSGLIIQLNGGTNIDNNAVLFKAGAHSVLDPLYNAGTLRKGPEVDVKDWNNAVATTDFQQALTQTGGKVDGVLAANDGIAGSAIGVLRAKKLTTVPVTGQDATVSGLQFILQGQQCMTVFKDVSKEATAASKLAIALVKGDTTAAKAMATGSLKDPKNGRTIPSLLLVPEAVTKDNIKDVVTAGAVTAADLCKGLTTLCSQAGVS
jgi:D-xylose transport system substrate-binding protein